jgi:RHS repeat-associated protein
VRTTCNSLLSVPSAAPASLLLTGITDTSAPPHSEQKYMYDTKRFTRIRGIALTALFMCLVFFAPPVLKAQDTLDGFPPYQAYQASNFDTFNVQNLTYGFAVPIASVPGRGLDLQLALHYSSSIWRLVQVPPGVGSSGWGWRLQTGYGSPGWSLGQVIPIVHYTVQSHQCDAGQMSYDFVSNFRISEPDGTTHTFPGFSIVADSPGPTKPGCTANTTGTVTTHSSDGWMLQMTLSGTLSVGAISGKVLAISPSGIQSQSSHPDYQTVPSAVVLQTGIMKDLNGNTITGVANGTNEVDWTDTLGREVLKIVTNTANTQVQYEVLNSSGTYTTTTFATKTMTIKTNFACAQGHSEGSYSGNLATSVTLPNGQQYTFTYEPTPGNSFATTGRLQTVTLPTGGIAQYTYPGPNDGVACTPEGASATNENQKPDQTNSLFRTVSNGSKTLNQTYSWVRQSGTTVQSTLITSATPADSHVASKRVVTLNGGITTDQQFDNAGTTILRTVITTLGSGPSPNPASKVTILEDSQTRSETDYTWHLTGLPQTQTDYDFGLGSHGPLIRTTNWSYLSGSAYTAKNVLDRVTDKTVSDPTGKIVFRTHTDYDQNAFTTCPTAVPGHDDTVLCSDLARGNATSLTRYTDAATPAGLIVRHASFDWFGNSRQADSDSCTQTTWNFSSTTEYAYPDSIVCGPAVGPSVTTTYTYDFNTGLLASQKDANGQITTFQHNDSLNRLTGVQYPDGGNVSYSYADSARVITTTTAIGNGVTPLTTKTVYDTLAQPSQAQLTSDPDCPSGVLTDTSYDALGRVYKVSNPYCTTGDPTYGLTTYTYDALGRTTQVAHPDGSTILTSYTGRAIQVQDEGNGNGTQHVTRISQTDGLGRLISICEVTGTSLIGGGGTPGACGQDISGTGFLTAYQYDALDNLTQVSQAGLNSRNFSYDSLSRLTTATNPESGTTSYIYDNNGNLFTKTDARNIRTTYAYDALNRLTGKTYSDTTPAVTFNYDQRAALGVTLTNTIGRKSSESTAGPNATGAVFSYDSIGRVVDNSQCTPLNCGGGVFSFQYPKYDFLGDLLTATNAGGVSVNFSYNSAARLTAMTTNFVDGSHPGTLFSNAHYGPIGLTSDTLGNGVNESFSYNNRGLLKAFAATSGTNTQYSFSVGTFAPNGDILAANDSVNGNWTYTYDPLNRLLSATTTGQAYTYDYDRFGNRWHQNGPRSSQLGFDANNRIVSGSGVTYDAGGNVTADGTHSYTFDAENRIASVDGGATASYVYDAEGRRARKTTASAGSVDYLYDLAGNEVSEVGATGVFNRGELYTGNRHLLTYTGGANGTTYFIHRDWLGTERVRTGVTGATCETIASLPFGDGQTISTTCPEGDVSPIHFTGKQRDPESGLDNFDFRYYGSSLGRFSSPDPVGGYISNPQSLNRYSYVMNNPLSLVDPFGLQGTCATMFSDKGEFLASTCPPDLGTGIPDSPSSPNNALYVASQPLAPPEDLPMTSGPLSIPGQVSGSSSLNATQMGLGLLGAIPGPVGTGANLINAGISLYRGNYGEAALNAAFAIPFVGTVGRIAELGKGTLEAAKGVEGIYEFTAASGKLYVGQSGNIGLRLADHLATGKLTLDGLSTVRFTEVGGGKLAREIAEQLRINGLGGIRGLENIRNPIGQARDYLMVPLKQ